MKKTYTMTEALNDLRNAHKSSSLKEAKAKQIKNKYTPEQTKNKTKE